MAIHFRTPAVWSMALMESVVPQSVNMLLGPASTGSEGSSVQVWELTHSILANTVAPVNFHRGGQCQLGKK